MGGDRVVSVNGEATDTSKMLFDIAKCLNLRRARSRCAASRWCCFWFQEVSVNDSLTQCYLQCVQDVATPEKYTSTLCGHLGDSCVEPQKGSHDGGGELAIRLCGVRDILSCRRMYEICFANCAQSFSLN